MEEIRTRFAPSPTGYLHVGGARTAIFNWLYARKNKGKFILRIEDTDIERSTQESVDAILQSLDWLGISYDEGPFYQSERLDLYKQHIDMLIEKNLAYYCTCSQERLDKVRNDALKKGQKPKYDGKCRELKLGKTKDATIRFKAPLMGETIIKDKVKNIISFNNEELDDFIIQRSNGMPTYNLTVVVDDVTMGINVIIRGDDHVNNTPKQIMLYEALGKEVPIFAHVPMVLGADKSRLSKRHGATSVFEYKKMGMLPEAMINYLVRLGWSYKDEEFFKTNDLIEKFNLENIGKSPSVFDVQKFLAINAQHIQKSSTSYLLKELKPFLNDKNIETNDDEKIIKIVDALVPRSKTIVEMADQASIYFQDIASYDEKGQKKFFKENILEPITSLKENLENLESFEAKEIEDVFKEILDKFEIGFGKIAQPVRLALTGTTQSPGIIEVIQILGKEETIKRLNAAILKIKTG